MTNASATYCCSKCHEVKDSSCFAPSQRRAGAWCRDCYRKWYAERSGGMVERPCNHCGVALTVTARRAAEPNVYCSRQCKEEERNLERRATIAVAAFIFAMSRPPCRHCGETMPATKRADARYCSERCNSRAHQQTRKASARIGARQERIDRASIIERDGAVCHICEQTVPEPLITIDHIVPLADGGSHEASNLAVACLPCNCRKGARSVEYARTRLKGVAA